MKKARTWSELVSVKSRYRRSVHLERDAGAELPLDGYILTPLVKRALRRVCDGLTAEPVSRAWSVTGPYGSGKSAFALFLTHLLSAPSSSRAAREARKKLQAEDKQLFARIVGSKSAPFGSSGLLPVLVTGESASLEISVLRALRTAASAYWPRRRAQIVDEIDEALDGASKGHRISPREVVRLAEELADKVASAKMADPAQGLLIILDEAGKSLEFAAQHPTRGDIHLLQELGEAANRGKSAKIVLLTLLHQGFERYAGRLGLVQRNEWTKVQGRFEDIAFVESLDQVVRLIGASLDKGDLATGAGRRLRTISTKVADHLDTALLGGEADLVQLLTDALPLHPVTTLLLGPLFRGSLAQNERSLFAFLAAQEPGGLQAFLSDPQTGSPGDWPLFTPDRLYDYFQNTWSTRFVGTAGRRWTQVDEALRRLPDDSDDIEVALTKTIGLLGIVGPTSGMVANEDLLRAAVGVGYGLDEKRFQLALRRLKDSSIVTFRRFRNAYQLWEGSDLDIDELVVAATRRVDLSLPTLHQIEATAPPRPIVAKRHMLQTGTMRYFEVHYADEGLLEGESTHTNRSVDRVADGSIWIILPTRDSETANFLDSAQRASLFEGQNPTLYCLPADSGAIRAAATEIAALSWIQAQASEIQSDAVAQREVRDRIADAEAQLRGLLAAVWSGDTPSTWYHQGKALFATGSAAVQWRFARLLNEKLSDICDSAFAQSPHIHNELVNRRALSSPAAAARRNLMQAMLENGQARNLGIEGSPPELSMYRSVLLALGLHRENGGVWGFAAPDELAAQQTPIGQLWAKLNSQALQAAGQKARLRVDLLYETLSAPPFGLKAGVLPVLLLAYLLSLHDEIALYEEGRFVPSISVPLLERLMRNPGKYELQRFRITGPRSDLFVRLSEHLLGAKSSPRSPRLVPIVRALVQQVAGLSDYARRTRMPNRINAEASARAVAVRDALSRARDPHSLLFSDLPKACGIDSIAEKSGSNRAAVKAFVDRLRSALHDLEQADLTLLEDLTENLRETFRAKGPVEKIRQQLAIRARRVLPILSEQASITLANRLSDSTLDDRGWLVSIATLLVGKPPASWNDQDIGLFAAGLAVGAQKLQSFEALVSISGEAEPGADEPRTLRVAVARPGRMEAARVLAISPDDWAQVAKCRDLLAAELPSFAGDFSMEQRIAALSLVLEECLNEMGQLRRSERTTGHR